MVALVLCLFLIVTYSQASPWDTLTANIAVVEFHAINNKSLSSIDKVTQNLQQHLDILLTTSKKTKLDMIIYPEGSLLSNSETSVEIQINDIPCISHKSYLQYVIVLSCAARNFTTYLVTNLVEKVKCATQNCKNYFYNTDLVFDRTGAIVSRYRKFNLFGEKQFDRPEKPEIVTLDTDFGIKFGVFTCFDILFKNPPEDVLARNVDGIIYPTNWHSELPFLTALQSQQMWAYAHNTTIFAAGGNNPATGSGGSAVHRDSRGTILNGFVAKGGSQILIFESVKGEVTSPAFQEVDDLGKEMENFPLITDNSLKDYQWSPVNTSEKNFSKQVCYGNYLCCDFTMKLTSSNPNGSFYTYLLVAYAGIRQYPTIGTAGLEVCAIIACLDSSISSCGRRFPKYEEIQWNVTFEELTIKASFEVNANKTQFPNSLLSSIRPIDASETDWSSKQITENGKEMIERMFSIRKSQNRILTFAIYGRNFAEDSFPEDNGKEKLR